jgi:hypothetical protein
MVYPLRLLGPYLTPLTTPFPRTFTTTGSLPTQLAVVWSHPLQEGSGGPIPHLLVSIELSDSYLLQRRLLRSRHTEAVNEAVKHREGFVRSLDSAGRRLPPDCMMKLTAPIGIESRKGHSGRIGSIAMGFHSLRNQNGFAYLTVTRHSPRDPEPSTRPRLKRHQPRFGRT